MPKSEHYCVRCTIDYKAQTTRNTCLVRVLTICIIHLLLEVPPARHPKCRDSLWIFGKGPVALGCVPALIASSTGSFSITFAVLGPSRMYRDGTSVPFLSYHARCHPVLLEPKVGSGGCSGRSVLSRIPLEARLAAHR